MKAIKYTKPQLVLALRTMLKCVEEDDSFEGIN
jgi:hypothetical protein